MGTLGGKEVLENEVAYLGKQVIHVANYFSR